MLLWIASLIVSVLLGLPFAAAGGPAEPRQVAVFDFELIDSSLSGEMLGPDEAEARRTEALGAQLREAFAASDEFSLSDVEPVRAEARRRHLQNCGGCDVTLAREVGADWAVTGTVQKVSNLILNINVYVRDTDDGTLLQAMSADIRGNTDKSWQRGLDWLIRNRFGLSR